MSEAEKLAIRCIGDLIEELTSYDPKTLVAAFDCDGGYSIIEVDDEPDSPYGHVVTINAVRWFGSFMEQQP